MTSLKDRFINIAAFNNDSKSSLVNFFFLYIASYLESQICFEGLYNLYNIQSLTPLRKKSPEMQIKSIKVPKIQE